MDAARPLAAWSLLALLCAGCGEVWVGEPHATADFDLACNHIEVPCESCHPEGSEPSQAPKECLACHEATRPTSHDPTATDNCAECHGGCTWDEGAGFHPDGFGAGAVHGQAMKLQDPSEGDCRECHGTDLTGGSAIGCDDCHTTSGIPDWRTDCVLCHGGSLDQTGAPPLDIDDQSDPDAITAPSHPAHATPDTHADVPCTTCHDGYTRALDPGHIFDPTPARAEVVMATGTWDGSGSCTNWCHGNGRSNGTASEGTSTSCTSCHSTAALSGEHGRHMGAGGRCADCHDSVVDRSNGIVGAPLHVNHSTDVALDPASGLSWSGTTCSGGRCHGVEYSHGGDRWLGN